MYPISYNDYFSTSQKLLNPDLLKSTKAAAGQNNNNNNNDLTNSYGVIVLRKAH